MTLVVSSAVDGSLVTKVARPWARWQAAFELAAAQLTVFKYIETFYKAVRLHQTLNYKSSNQHEADHAPAMAA